MRAEPSILTGPRAGRGTPERDQQTTSVPETVHPGLYSRISALLRGKNLIVEKAEKTPYEVIFTSKYSRHMIQVTAPEDQVDGKTGHKTKGRPIVVRFDKGVFSVPKKYNTEQATTIIKWLRDHPNYGRDFTEQKDVANDLLIRRTVQVIESITESKPMREAVLDFLSRGDYLDEDKGDSEGLGNRVLDEVEDEEDGEDEDEEDYETEEALASAEDLDDAASASDPEPAPRKKGGWPKGKPRKKVAPPPPQVTKKKKK